MALKDQIQDDTKKAMKAKDPVKVGVLRMIFSEIRRFEIDNRKDITDDEVIKILKRGVKSREESVALYRKGEREELAQKEEQEIEIISQYLPKQLSINQVEEIVESVIAEHNLSHPKDMGVIMREVMSRYGSQVDGKTVQEVARVKLRG